MRIHHSYVTEFLGFFKRGVPTSQRWQLFTQKGLAQDETDSQEGLGPFYSAPVLKTEGLGFSDFFFLITLTLE